MLFTCEPDGLILHRLDVKLCWKRNLRLHENAYDTRERTQVWIGMLYLHFPNELLTQIFEFGTQDWAASSVAASVPPFPVAICGVCKHWREVALKSPDLWSTIHIPISSSSTSAPTSLNWVQTWVDRSNSAPLTVTLDIPLLPADRGLHAATLLSTVIKYPIRRLDIRSQNDKTTRRLCLDLLRASNRNHNVYEQISLCFPNNRRGKVRFTKEHHLLREEWGYSSGYLEKFTVSKLRVWGLCVYPPQFPNLTSLTAWDVEATFLEFRGLLTESPSLTTLVLCRLHASPSPEIGRPITVPSLRYLAVSFNFRSNSSGIYPIRYLRLPNLSYLELNVHSDVSLLSAFENSISSADRLHTLKVFNFPRGILHGQLPGVGTNVVAQEDLDGIFFLRSLTSVRHLHLIDSAAALLSSFPDAAPRRLRRPYIDDLVQKQPFSPTGMLAKLRQGAAQLQLPEIDERTSGSKPTSIPLPNLQTITLATLAADDLVDLCHYVGAQMGQLEAVYLSTAAQRHLSHTLARKPGEDTFAVSELPCTGPKKRDVVGVDQAKDADDWLRKRVEVRKFDPALRHDLLEDTTGQDPVLGEMF